MFMIYDLLTFFFFIFLAYWDLAPLVISNFIISLAFVYDRPNLGLREFLHQRREP